MKVFPSDSFFACVSVAIQFTSQVLPPSSENARSKRPESSNTEESIKPLDSLKSNWLRLGQLQGVLPEWLEIWKFRCATLLLLPLQRHPLNTCLLASWAVVVGFAQKMSGSNPCRGYDWSTPDRFG